MLPSVLLGLAGLLPLAAAQLSGHVGPTTSRAAKAAVKVCNILNYGGVASATVDNGAALAAAWAACKTGGEVLIPAGSYGLGTWQTLSGGAHVSINLEGQIFRISSATSGGNMLVIQKTTDFEFFSGNSKGAIQGYGYEFHTKNTYGPRLLRLIQVTDFSVHDIAIVDSPSFHFLVDTCTNGEVYNVIVRGGNKGGLDGIDVWGTNIWVHDVEVTNRDECVTVKNLSKNLLIENVFCNWSGGSAIGSLGTNVDVHDIEYNNVYSQNCNQMMMIKSNGGSGELYNAKFSNFMGHSNAYSLTLNAFWSSLALQAGDGVQYTNLSFSNWHGTSTNGVQRGPMQILCPSSVPCKEIAIDNFAVWTETGSSEKFVCQNAYGSGGCVRAPVANAFPAYTTTQTIATVAGYAVPTMPGELKAGLGITAAIAIPPVPTTFFPGQKPVSALLG